MKGGWSALRCVELVVGVLSVGLFLSQTVDGADRSNAQWLMYSTCIGGSNEDSIRDVAADREGNIYITGGTGSANFPTTPGAFDRTFNGWHDVFVAKLDPNGKLMWSTLIGGPNYDRAYAVEVDKKGYVYVTGRAGPGFPVTANAFQRAFKGFYTGKLYGEQNAFVAKLTPDGSGLVFSSYFGPVEMNRDLAIGRDGDIYVASSYDPKNGGSFPETWLAKAFQRKPRGGHDGVVARIKSDGSRVLWATLLGGSEYDSGQPSIRVDASGSPVILFGVTKSQDLPTTPGAYDRTYNGGGDVYVAKLSPDGSKLIYGTYLGGSQAEFTETHSLTLDAQGNAIVAAVTKSADFPTTPGGFQRTYGGSGGPGTGAGTNYPGDAFVSKISSDGSHLLGSTFVGGRHGEGAEGVAVDMQGNVYFSGATYSDDFPVTMGAFQTRNGGQADFFAVKLSPDLGRLLYSTYLGGAEVDYGRTATVDGNGNFYVAGMTQSSDWPTHNAPQAARGGNWDGAITKFGPRTDER